MVAWWNLDPLTTIRCGFCVAVHWPSRATVSHNSHTRSVSFRFFTFLVRQCKNGRMECGGAIFIVEGVPRYGLVG